MTKTCKLCFIDFKDESRYRALKYCSESCRKDSSRKRRRKDPNFTRNKECPVCNCKFFAYSPNKTYCSEKCYDLHFRAKKYGMTAQEMIEFLKVGKCEICSNSVEPLKLSIDHCHKTGKLRKPLCKKCNTGLGQFMDNTQLLKNAIDYLRRYGC